MKKVYCLYRGSNEEIEAQKLACYSYAKLQGWTITKEFSEEGSGSDDKKDSLRFIHDEALKERLDILLVHDFNNISWDEMEIPYAASWFIENGIDIVSVKYDKRDFEKERRESLNNINCWRL